MHSIEINKNIEKKRKARNLKNKKRREERKGKEIKLYIQVNCSSILFRNQDM